MSKTLQVQSTCGRWALEKAHAAVARTAFSISKSKYTKHLSSGELLDGELLKKRTRLWRAAYFEVIMLKTSCAWSTFGSWAVQKVHTVVARSIFGSENAQNNIVSEHFWTLLEVAMLKKCTLLWRGTFATQTCKNWQSRTIFWTFICVFHDRHKGFITLPKLSKTWRSATTTTLQQLQLQLQLHPSCNCNCTRFQLYCTTLHWTTLHCNHTCNCNCNYSYNYHCHYMTTTITTTRTTKTKTTLHHTGDR